MRCPCIVFVPQSFEKTVLVVLSYGELYSKESHPPQALLGSYYDIKPKFAYLNPILPCFHVYAPVIDLMTSGSNKRVLPKYISI